MAAENHKIRQPQHGMSSLTRLIYEHSAQKRAPESAGSVVTTESSHGNTSSSSSASRPDVYNGTITTTISLEGVSPHNSRRNSSGRSSPRGFAPGRIETAVDVIPELAETPSALERQELRSQRLRENQMSSESAKNSLPSSSKSITGSSYISLSNMIPYSAPGTKDEHLSSSVTSLSNLSSNFSLPSNGQLITGNRISSPTVTSPSQLESRFIVSKQRIHPAQSSSSLVNFFSSSTPRTSGSIARTPRTSSHSSADSGAGAGATPGSGAGTTYASRHSSMADLRHFFKKSLTFGSPRSDSYSSKLSAGLSAQRQSGTQQQQQQDALGGSSLPPPSPVALRKSYGPEGSYSAHLAERRGSMSTNMGTSFKSVGSLTNLSGSTSSGHGAGGGAANGGASGGAGAGGAPSADGTAYSVSVGGNRTPEIPFKKRYSRFGDSLGKGAGGTVRLMKRLRDGRVFAVKKFRSRYAHESRRDYTKKITSEYCIGSTLKHPNIIETVEIAYDADHMYQVMEYCEYDLFAIVMSNKMSENEINCCFKQVLNGVRYLHSIGLAHRDLKLDNCVVNRDGIVKIIDFGSAVVFQYPFSRNLVEASGIVGSDPYLAPELCVFSKYDPRPVDVWSCAIIYCCMALKKFPWRVPTLSDNSFKLFASRKPGATFGELLKEVPAPPAYDEVEGVKKDDEGDADANGSKDDDVEHAGNSKESSGEGNKQIDEENARKSSKENAKESKADSNIASTNSSNSKDSGSSKNSQKHTSNLMGEARLLNALPKEVRSLIGGMVELAPACRISIDECFNDRWLRNVEMCRLVDENGEDCSTGRLVKATNHVHTQVDQSVAHIAALERNRRKEKKEKKDRK
ncbi:hypothetical protein BRETT_001331 [Brettanomyces bruxellensis]|uniref:non-specific serine/threonine protein kinase n=1 Tax=Dekkera bruxellensis TaxID=5007 RepID=A0A871R8L8_DEKBR|nr:uncharacterized protein BRETT_001331 [Brettanomyces bruxellensis]QOU21606.1 hypothetical protein BRETT_001331 [Brettanomyces bruxellensis]